ncbi:MAG: hypothetical protein RL708_2124 [Bacteroidota bacterium]|jgi:hypothetical protein
MVGALTTNHFLSKKNERTFSFLNHIDTKAISLYLKEICFKKQLDFFINSMFLCVKMYFDFLQRF